ncbi:hypothetical protein [Acidocella sp.]|uniref:hypothetical protein n=1 Tax=Acidocella sp. TaxID=50710 RepID=UPI0026190E36|nr:hypothetical protein [Acidocella sp.]MDD2795959.1 hypothetical protein [Acidocella sp.]
MKTTATRTKFLLATLTLGIGLAMTHAAKADDWRDRGGDGWHHQQRGGDNQRDHWQAGWGGGYYPRPQNYAPPAPAYYAPPPAYYAPPAIVVGFGGDDDDD